MMGDSVMSASRWAPNVTGADPFFSAVMAQKWGHNGKELMCIIYIYIISICIYLCVYSFVYLCIYLVIYLFIYLFMYSYI